jgi:flagellar hook-length control protein FliK
VPPQPALAALLQERLQVQIAKRSEHAVVRLDPPSLGTIEISIRHEGGQLQVHLRASHGEVARQLHAIGENLRQDLLQRHETVSVHVFDSTRDGERRRERQMPWQDTPGRALDESGDEPASFAMNVANE